VLSAECGEPRPFAARPSDALGSPIPEHWDWGPRSRPGFRVPLGTHFPSSFAWLAAQNLEGMDTQGLTDFGAVAERSVWFRNFPFRSVSFRSVPSGSERTPYCLVPGAWCLFRSRCLSGVAGSCEAGSCEASAKQDGEAGRRSRIREVRGSKQEMHCAARTYRFRGGCETFRFVPELSETFRFVPFRSVSFRPDPSGFRTIPGGRGLARGADG